MKISIICLIVSLMSAASNASRGVDTNIIYSEKTIDFYEGSIDKQHTGSLVEVWMTSAHFINLSIGTMNPETHAPIELSEANKASLKNMVIELVEKTPTAMNFSKEDIEEGALTWVSEVADSGGASFINLDSSDKFISNIPMSKEASVEWQQASQLPARYTFRLGVLTETVKNQVNGVLGEGFDMNHRCSSGTYHKIFFEVVAAETIAGKKLNHIGSSKSRFFLNMAAKNRRNLFLGSSVSFHPPVDSTPQEIQAICDGLL